MDQSTKEKFEVASKIVAILGGIISAVALVVTLQSGTEQRASELRWRQANLAMVIRAKARYSRGTDPKVGRSL